MPHSSHNYHASICQLMIINQFDTNNETNEKKENMTIKPDKKRVVKTINIRIPTTEILITYASIYSKLNNEGKELAQKQLKFIGENFDLMQEKINKFEKQKNKGVK